MKFNKILICIYVLIICNISCKNTDEELRINEEKKQELVEQENNLRLQEQKIRDLQIELENQIKVQQQEKIGTPKIEEENISNVSSSSYPKINQKKFAFVFISYYEETGGKIINGQLPKSYSNAWSEITEFNEWNKDIEYKFMDEAENQLLFRAIKTITSRKCYSFNSYSEASKYLEKLKNE